MTRLPLRLFLGAAALAAFIALPIATGAAAETRPDATPADALRARADSLKTAARLDDALAITERRLALLRNDTNAKPYQVADAEREIETLRHVLTLPRAQQQEFAAVWDVGTLAKDYMRRGAFTEGAAALRERVAELETLVGREHVFVAVALHNLGSMYWNQGKFTEAGPYWRESFAMSRALLGDEDPRIADGAHNLAALLWLEGNYAGAEPLLRRSLAIRRSVQGEDNPGVAVTLNSLALLLWSKGDLAAAEPVMREALDKLQAQAGGDINNSVIGAMNNLAGLLQERGELDAAEPLYREALAGWRELRGDEDSDVAASMASLARLLMEKGDDAAAETLLRDALAMQERLLGSDHHEVAQTLGDLGRLHHARGDETRAETFLRRSLAIRRGLFGDEHPHVAETRRDLGLVLYAQARYAAADSQLTLAAAAYESARQRAGQGLSRVTFLRSPYPALALVRLKENRNEDAWPACERDLGRVLADVLLAADSRPLSAAEAAREDSLLGALGRLEQGVTFLLDRARADTTGAMAAQVNDMRARFSATSAAWAEFQLEMAREYPVSEGRAFDLDRVQATLTRDRAIVGWLDVETHPHIYESWGYVVRHVGDVRWFELNTRAATSSFEAAERLRVALASPSAGDWKDDAAALYRERIAPLMTALDGVRELLVIPSGAMLGVPVEALHDGRDRFVGERFSVSYIPSATIYAWLGERAKRRTGRRTDVALLVADAPYRAEHVSAAGAMTAPSDEAVPYRSALAGSREALARLPRLPGSAREARAISGMFREAHLLIGRDATERALVDEASGGRLGTYAVLHFAVHGLTDDERPERSALVLSQVGVPDPLEAALAGARIYDGAITAGEVLREWRLDANLVTLSACRTGLGKAIGGEGYIGLAHAFLQVGARSLLVSLWNVEDTATRLLMQRFYENYTGRYRDERGGRTGEPMSRANALAEARRWLRSYVDPTEWDPPYAHPYYWAAFVLIGDRS